MLTRSYSESSLGFFVSMTELITAGEMPVRDVQCSSVNAKGSMSTS